MVTKASEEAREYDENNALDVTNACQKVQRYRQLMVYADLDFL